MYTGEDVDGDAEDLMDLPPPLARPSPFAISQEPTHMQPVETSSSTSHSKGVTQAYKIPLTPSKLVKQKRYPGMLISPEDPEKMKASREEDPSAMDAQADITKTSEAPENLQLVSNGSLS